MSRGVALRRLSSVEVDLGASHQREFHAGALRRKLGFRVGTTSARALAAYCPSDGDILCEDTGYTLYDARKPPRSEYHLYPATRLFLDHANAGDLLVILRTGAHDDLCIVVAERGSSMESSLLSTYLPSGAGALERFEFSEAPVGLDLNSGSARSLVDIAHNLGFELS